MLKNNMELGFLERQAFEKEQQEFCEELERYCVEGISNFIAAKNEKFTKYFKDVSYRDPLRIFPQWHATLGSELPLLSWKVQIGGDLHSIPEEVAYKMHELMEAILDYYQEKSPKQPSPSITRSAFFYAAIAKMKKTFEFKNIVKIEVEKNGK